MKVRDHSKAAFLGAFQGSPSKQQRIESTVCSSSTSPKSDPLSSPDQCSIVCSNHMGAREVLKACHHPAEGNEKPLSSGSQLISPSTSAVLPRALSVSPAPSDSTTINSHPKQKSSTEYWVFVLPQSRSNRSVNSRELVTGNLAH